MLENSQAELTSRLTRSNGHATGMGKLPKCQAWPG